MNISYRWIRELAPDLEDSPEEVAHRLAMYGAPVDERVALGDPLRDLVVARVERVREHPNADRLVLCDVDAGTGESLQIVCGAPNVRGGAFYPFAPVNATLPGGVEIRRAKIRGERSSGMLCSERELGLGRDQEGLMELAGRFTPGEPLVEALGLDDVRLVLDVTPNRPDLLSHLGVARELAPDGENGIALPPFPGDEDTDAGAAEAARVTRVADEGAAGGVAVRIDDPHGCPRYLGAVIRDVNVGPSPQWLAARLRAIGLRPINNVVDATNYVLYELGQPVHAFDLDRLTSRAVRVRRADAGETIVTLDGERRVLEDDVLVIADAERPVAVAGVMGGRDSEVSEETTDVFLECALFDPKSVRRTARALGLSTDASYRFERGVDPEGLERALRRLIALVSTVAGGSVEPEAVDVHPEPAEAPVVTLRPARVTQVLGESFDDKAIVGYLEPLGFEALGRENGARSFRVPGWRWYDIEREADLIEEVARRHGYDAFGSELHGFRPSVVPDDVMAGLEGRLRGFFVGRGFLEARTTPFAPEDEGDVELLHPLSAAESRLRRELTPGLLHRVEYNFARGQRHVRLFEIGTVFSPAGPDEPPREATRVAAAFTGARTPPHWSPELAAYDVWDLKALLADLCELLGVGAAAVAAGREPAAARYASDEAFHVRGSGGEATGRAGRVAPHALDAPAWADPVWALELTLSPAMAERETPVYQPLPTQPAIERDLALLVPDDVAAARVESTLREAAGEHLESVHPFDLYRGRGVPGGVRSIAYRVRFRAPDRTLKDREADDAIDRVLRRLEEELGVRRR